MSRYDGLIIPRSYSEYINKTDAATLQQALQLPGVLSGAVAAGDNKAVKSSAVNAALANYPKTEKVLNIDINNTIDKNYKILTWKTTNKGGAIIRVDFSSRFGNSGFGSGSIFVTFNSTIQPSIWLLGEMNSQHAYFRITKDVANSNIAYLELVTLGGTDRRLVGTIKITPLVIYESTITYHELEQQTNEVDLIDSSLNNIIKNKELENKIVTFSVNGFKVSSNILNPIRRSGKVIVINLYGHTTKVIAANTAFITDLPHPAIDFHLVISNIGEIVITTAGALYCTSELPSNKLIVSEIVYIEA